MILIDDAGTIVASAVRLTIPLAFAASGEYVAERAGTLNISVEGMMLGGAFTGTYVGFSVTGSPALGLLAGAGAGMVLALIHANFSHRLQANTFVVGLALNALALGVTSYLIQTRVLSGEGPGTLTIPGLSRLPVVGEAFFSQPWPAYVLYALVPLIWWLVMKTRWGLEVRSVGENPQAADVTGIDVNRRRRQALLLCGVLSGLGGAYYAVAHVHQFNSGMTAGRGFIVIAAVIFGGWTLRGAIAGCFLFGGADALQLSLPSLGYTINPQLLTSAPYLLALLAMLFFAKRNRPPLALARPFERGAT